MKQICSLLFVLFFLMPSKGQNPKQHELENISVGQSKLISKNSSDKYSNASHNIHCSLRDKAGNLWFGTTGDGVYRFDGKLFVNFTAKDGLSNDCVWSVLEDKAGNIWFGTKTGVCRFDGKTISKVPIANTVNTAFGMLQDKRGIIWFGTANGIYCYDGKSFTHFLENDSIINKDGLQLKLVERILEDNKGNIWFGSGMLGGEGVCRYDGKSVISFKPNSDVWIPYMLEDKVGNIWFSGRSHGNFRFDGSGFTDFTENVEFGPIIKEKVPGICLTGKVGVGPILEDRAGNLWFTGKMMRLGGDGGIWRFDGKSCANFSVKEGLGDYAIWCMTQDTEGNIWVGTNDTGLFRFDGKTFSCFSEKESK